MPEPSGGLLEGMRYDVWGEGSRPFLLLVHGFLSSRAQWRPNLEALARVATPVTVELLGHGRSQSRRDPESYGVGAYVRRFEGLRERLGAERWFICGQSFGAGLTIRYAIEHPRRVIGQVFTNSISGFSPPMRVDPAARAAHADALERGGHQALKAMSIYPRPSRRLPPEIWQGLVADAELLSPRAVAEAMRGTVPGLSVLEDLARIAVPSLLVNGTARPRSSRCATAPSTTSRACRWSISTAATRSTSTAPKASTPPWPRS
ncbi:MAG: alpha/beta fold hydrolase [Caulobacterales bacterium]